MPVSLWIPFMWRLVSALGGRNMVVTVEGVYTDGSLELLDKPNGIRNGRVRVTLTEEEPKPPVQMLPFGKYRGGPDCTLEDFKIAEWNGEPEFDDLFPVRD